MDEVRWNLERYYYTGLHDPKLLRDITEILPAVEAFVQKHGERFATYTDPNDISTFYEEYSLLKHTIETPSYYLFYYTSLETQHPQALKKQRELDLFFTQVQAKLLFVNQGWKKMGYKKIMKLAQEPLLSDYKNDLLSIANEIGYLLSEEAEKVLSYKEPILTGTVTLYQELVSSFLFSFQKGKETLLLTQNEVQSYRKSQKRDLRKAAYDALRSVYNTPSHKITLGNIYMNVVKNWTSDMILRGYGTNVLEPRNIYEQLDHESVEILLESVQNAYPLYQRYLTKKAALLQLSDDFSIWDTSVSLGKHEQSFSFQEAFDIHLKMAKAFDHEFYTFSQRMLTEGRIDAFPKKGKRGGAFASYRKDDPSFVLLNFTGNIRDISTLSHELGHAFHGMLAQEQKAPVYATPLSLAETASLFSENLLADTLESMMSGKQKYIYLDNRLDDLFSTIFRQIQYICFEKRVHALVLEEKSLGYQELGILWREEQIKLYGTKMRYDVSPEEETTWAQIPHIFHTPFYCYSYAFGNILALTLSHHIKTGQMSIEAYKNILRSGGSERPRELLLSFGIDIRKPAFYQGALKEIEALLQSYEGITSF